MLLSSWPLGILYWQSRPTSHPTSAPVPWSGLRGAAEGTVEIERGGQSLAVKCLGKNSTNPPLLTAEALTAASKACA